MTQLRIGRIEQLLNEAEQLNADDDIGSLISSPDSTRAVKKKISTKIDVEMNAYSPLTDQFYSILGDEHGNTSLKLASLELIYSIIQI